MRRRVANPRGLRSTPVADRGTGGAKPSGAGRGAAVRRRLKMRDLERETGVGREAIRFYIREGLLPEPERPARNVAWYDESFVERVRLIKRLQQERFLPLAVIKGTLGVRDVPSSAEVETLLELDATLGPDPLRPPRAPESPSRLAARVGLPASELRELARLGAVEIATRGGRQWIDGRSVEIVEVWAKMRHAGFSERLGFGPDDAALPVQVAEWLAREQLRLFTRQVTGRVDRDTARRMAEVGLECVPRLTALLHEAALLRLIASGNLPESSAPQDEAGRPKAS